MKLSEYLKENNITQAAFGEKIGKSQQLVSGYCTGALIPPRDTMLRIKKETRGQVSEADMWPGFKVA